MLAKDRLIEQLDDVLLLAGVVVAIPIAIVLIGGPAAGVIWLVTFVANRF